MARASDVSSACLSALTLDKSWVSCDSARCQGTGQGTKGLLGAQKGDDPELRQGSKSLPTGQGLAGMTIPDSRQQGPKQARNQGFQHPIRLTS